MPRATAGSLRQGLEHRLVRAAIGAVRALPRRAVGPLGTALGEIGYRLDRKHPRIARYNLESALPELDRDRIDRLVRRCYHHFGTAFLDSVSFTGLDPVALCEAVSLDGWERIARAEAAGRGVIFLSAHLGCWELLGQVLPLYKGPMTALAKPAANPRVDAEIRALRERHGVETAAKRGSARVLLRTLGSGGRVILLIDQRVHPDEGIEVPFFGRPSWTTPLLAGISLRSGAPVVPIFARREGERYRIVVRRPIEPEGEGETATRELTRRYLAAIEREIRRAPEQWLWMHERWRVH